MGKAVSAARAIRVSRESSSTSSSTSPYYGTRKNKTGTGDKRGSISVGLNATGSGLGRRRREKDGVEAEREKAKEMEDRERLEKEHAKEEWRRMLLCEVMFLDLCVVLIFFFILIFLCFACASFTICTDILHVLLLHRFTSDAFGLQPHITSSTYASVKLPSSAVVTSSLDFGSTIATAAATAYSDRYGLINDDDIDDDEESNDLSVRARRPSYHQNQSPNDEDMDAGVEAHSYLGARYKCVISLCRRSILHSTTFTLFFLFQVGADCSADQDTRYEP